MKLEVNHSIIADEANEELIKQAIREQAAADEVFVTLHDGEDIIIQAAGSTEDGFAMIYNNKSTGVEFISTNKKLKAVSVIRVLNHFLKGDTSWREDIGWRAASAEASAEEKKAARRRNRPIILSFLFLMIAYIPLVLGTTFLLKALIFIPMCAQTGLDTSRFDHGSYGINTSSNPPTCWYEDGSSILMSEHIGDGAMWIDFVAVIAEVVIPMMIILLILLVVAKVRGQS